MPEFQSLQPPGTNQRPQDRRQGAQRGRGQIEFGDLAFSAAQRRSQPIALRIVQQAFPKIHCPGNATLLKCRQRGLDGIDRCVVVARAPCRTLTACAGGFHED
jgi:hypothetical protein